MCCSVAVSLRKGRAFTFDLSVNELHGRAVRASLGDVGALHTGNIHSNKVKRLWANIYIKFEKIAKGCRVDAGIHQNIRVKKIWASNVSSALGKLSLGSNIEIKKQNNSKLLFICVTEIPGRD